MLTFIKLGGSLITHKRESQSFYADVTRRVAQEIAKASALQPQLRLLIGHGAGSFGHVVAHKHGTISGVRTANQWRGFAEVATVARRLNALVMETLDEAQLPIFCIQPSSSALCEGGKLVKMDTAPISAALEHGLMPVVNGDVAIDSILGGTIISTETIFSYLAEKLRPERILLIGDVEGVYDGSGRVIEYITPANLEAIAPVLGGSKGTDVTGGMESKVRQMVELAQRLPGLQIRIFGGNTPGLLEATLVGKAAPGTLICEGL